MIRVRIAELKDHLSEHLRAVERGAEIVVTDRNRPIARISPIAGPGRHVRLVPPTRDFMAVRDQRRVDAGWTVASTLVLLEERSDR